MRTTLKSIFLAALLVQAGPTFAQETQNEDQAETTEQSNQAASDLSLGEPVGPQVGQPYILNENGDWQTRCIKAPEGQDDSCNLYQLLLDTDGNQVSEVSVFRLPDGRNIVAGAEVVVPLETLLTQQLTLTIDSGEARRYPFTFCNAAGCVARVGFTQAEIDQLKRGNSARLRLVPAAAPDQEVLLTMSLSGFTAAFDNVTAIQ